MRGAPLGDETASPASPWWRGGVVVPRPPAERLIIGEPALKLCIIRCPSASGLSEFAVVVTFHDPTLATRRVLPPCQGRTCIGRIAPAFRGAHPKGEQQAQRRSWCSAMLNWTVALSGERQARICTREVGSICA